MCFANKLWVRKRMFINAFLFITLETFTRVMAPARHENMEASRILDIIMKNTLFLDFLI